MKKILFFCFCFPLFLFPQKKYQSLLWEISGNNLKKKSYLYGTMHVSDKVAFHLSDAFFDKIKTVDMVATETDPQEWLDYMKEDDLYSRNNADNFYQNFVRKPLEKRDIPLLFQSNEYLVNGILHRNSNFQKNFQENTYIDMFIFQAGKKLNKKTFGLEDYHESERLAEKAFRSQDYGKPKPYITKLIGDRNADDLLGDAYRNKDLDMLDSLQKGMNSDDFLKYILYERNINMVNAMDTLMPKGSLFAAVGAGHLPGNEGMIELLRKKGYTVSPIIDFYTDKGKLEKEKIENYIKPVKLQYVQGIDKSFQIKSPNKLLTAYDKQAEINMAMDIGNGGYLVINRGNTFEYLKQGNYKINLNTIDSLLYENIPGKIYLKEKININGMEGLKIESKTEANDINKFKIIITPLEILTVNVSGKKNYADVIGTEIINSLTLKPMTNEWTTMSPINGGYSIYLPAYYTQFESTAEDPNFDSPQVYAYDNSDQSYYWVYNEVINDLELENTEFELQRILTESADESDSQINITKTNIKGNESSSEGNYTIKNGETIYLKSIINGSQYYLMGSSSKNEQKRKEFFNSFKLEPFKAIKKRKSYKDTLTMFEVEVPIKPEKDLYAYDYYEEERGMEFQNGEASLTMDNGETIYISYEKNEDYKIIKDSLDFQKDILHPILANICNKKIEFVKKGNHHDDYQFYDYILSDTLSTQVIKRRYYHKDDKLYTLEYLDSQNNTSPHPSVKDILANIKFIEKVPKKQNKDEVKEEIIENIEEYDGYDDGDAVADTLSADAEWEDKYDFEPNIKSNQKLFDQIKSYQNSQKNLRNLLLTKNFSYPESEALSLILSKIENDSISSEELNSLLNKYYDRTNFIGQLLPKIIEKDQQKGLKTVLNFILKYQPDFDYRDKDNIFYEIKTIDGYEDIIYPKILNLLNNTDYCFDLMTLLANLKDENELKPKYFQSKISKINQFIDKELKDFIRYYTQDYSSNNFDLGDMGNALNVLNTLDNKSSFNGQITKIRQTKIPELLEVLLKIEPPVQLTPEEFKILENDPETKTFAIQKQAEITEGEKPSKMLIEDVFEAIKNDDYTLKENDSLILKEEKIITVKDKKYQVFLIDVFNFKDKKEKNKYIKDSLYFRNNKAGNVKVMVYDLSDKIEENNTDKEDKPCYTFDLPINTKEIEDDDENEEDDYYEDDLVYDKYNEDSLFTRVFSSDVPIFNNADKETLYRQLIDYLEHKDKDRAHFKVMKYDKYYY